MCQRESVLRDYMSNEYSGSGSHQGQKSGPDLTASRGGVAERGGRSTGYDYRLHSYLFLFAPYALQCLQPIVFVPFPLFQAIFNIYCLYLFCNLN